MVLMLSKHAAPWRSLHRLFLGCDLHFGRATFADVAPTGRTRAAPTPVCPGAAARLYQGHRERLASIPGRTRAGVVLHHRPHVRKLAVEATDNGLLAPELAAGIQRVKSAKSIGVRAGNWLSLRQAQALLNAKCCI